MEVRLKRRVVLGLKTEFLKKHCCRSVVRFEGAGFGSVTTVYVTKFYINKRSFEGRGKY